MSAAPKCAGCWFVRSTRYGGQCVHPEALVGVWDTGVVYASSCLALRHPCGKCGPEGKLFQPGKTVVTKETVNDE